MDNEFKQIYGHIWITWEAHGVFLDIRLWTTNLNKYMGAENERVAELRADNNFETLPIDTFFSKNAA